MYGSAYFALDSAGGWYKIHSIQNIGVNNNINIAFNITLGTTGIGAGSYGMLYLQVRTSATGSAGKALYVDETTGNMTNTNKIALVESIQDGKLTYDIYVSFYTKYQGWRLAVLDASWLTGNPIPTNAMKAYINSELKASDLLENLPNIDDENILSITYARSISKS